MIEVFDIPEEYRHLLESLVNMDENDAKGRSKVVNEINRIRDIAFGLGIREEFERIYGPVMPPDQEQLR